MKASDNRFTLLSDLEMIRKSVGVDLFHLDPCADERSPASQTISHLFTQETDGLNKDWSGNVFVNPPFSNIAPWVDKSIKEINSRIVSSITLLLPANRTDQHWFQSLWDFANTEEFRWLSPRLKFGTPEDPHGIRKNNHPPFACLTVTLRGGP